MSVTKTEKQEDTGSGDASERLAEPVAETALDSTSASLGSVVVEGVDFESLPDLDRVVLHMASEAEAQIYAPDPGTVVVDLHGVRIAKSMGRRVDTKEFGGPIDLFSVFQTPDVPGDQVRVVLKRHGVSEPRLTWADGRLTLELERDLTAMGPAESSGHTTPALPDRSGEAREPSFAEGGTELPGRDAEASVPAAPAPSASRTS